jgi:hypothetical protein
MTSNKISSKLLVKHVFTHISAQRGKTLTQLRPESYPVGKGILRLRSYLGGNGLRDSFYYFSSMKKMYRVGAVSVGRVG